MTIFYWNPLVAPKNRYPCSNYNDRLPIKTTPTHIVLHITGHEDRQHIVNEFMRPHNVAPHYLIDRDGTLLQFVAEGHRAWHAGVDSATRSLYARGKSFWMRYIKYFSWYDESTGYPFSAVFVDENLNPVSDKSQAFYVTTADNTPWPLYDYFNCRWTDLQQPVNYAVDQDPNNFSIGIETLGCGAPTADPAIYTPEMYKGLTVLIRDISQRYNIPIEKGRVVGHEDVNPISRFGWDPNGGFDWERIYKAGQT